MPHRLPPADSTNAPLPFTGAAPASGRLRPRVATVPLDSLLSTPNFRDVFDHAPLGMALVDGQGRFLRVNRSVCQITGYSAEELLSRDFLSITHADDRELFLHHARRAWQGEADDFFHADFRYVHRQGHTVWTQTSASIVRDDSGRPYYGVAQLQDISARHHVQRLAHDRQTRLERLTWALAAISGALATSDEAVLPQTVLRVAMDCFHSPAGLFVCRDHEGLLVGSYAAETGTSVVRAHSLCPLWQAAMDDAAVQVENRPRGMGCGRMVTRSLVAPLLCDGVPLGVLHLCDAACDYDNDDRELIQRVAQLVAPALQWPLKLRSLTPREAEVMQRIVNGLSQKQIAVDLSISIQTVAKHRAKVLDKLGAGNDVELVRLALGPRTPYYAALAQHVARWR